MELGCIDYGFRQYATGNIHREGATNRDKSEDLPNHNSFVVHGLIGSKTNDQDY